MPHPGVEKLLRSVMGLDAASVGSSLIDRAVAARMEAQGVRTVEEYLELLRTSPEEVQALIEGVVVPETWFFRGPEAFAAMTQEIQRRWVPRHLPRPLRVLSVPCSTGEEPYSIAMALLDAGFVADRFRIEAVDISLRALNKARRGVYGQNSFRGQSLGFRDRYFSPVTGGYRVDDRVREGVEFRQGNLLASAGNWRRGPYDVLFCRNVLIYFDGETQRRVMEGLIQLLDSEGLVFVGTAEGFLARDAGLRSTGHPMAFAYRKGAVKGAEGAGTGKPGIVALGGGREARKGRPAGGQSPKPVLLPPLSVPRLTRADASRVSGERGSGAGREPGRKEVSTDTGVGSGERTGGRDTFAATGTGAGRKPDLLAEARRLADQGRLDQAAQACEGYLRAEGPSAEAFCLLGVIREAENRADMAMEAYRKALYLMPDHAETLAHMALLAERTGNAAAARNLRARADRAERAQGKREERDR